MLSPPTWEVNVRSRRSRGWRRWEGTGAIQHGRQGSIGVANDPESSTQAPDVEYLLLPDEHFTWSFPAALGIGTGSQNREAAYQFIEWYTGAENQAGIDSDEVIDNLAEIWNELMAEYS